MIIPDKNVRKCYIKLSYVAQSIVHRGALEYDMLLLSHG